MTRPRSSKKIVAMSNPKGKNDASSLEKVKRTKETQIARSPNKQKTLIRGLICLGKEKLYFELLSYLEIEYK